MFISELFHGGPKQPQNQKQADMVVEANHTRLVVLFPGRFQPFHRGHAQVFAKLQAKFGRDNVYISTSNSTKDSKTVWNFSDRIKFMHVAGITADRIIEQSQPLSLPPQFAPGNTIFILARGEADAEELNVGNAKKDGNPGYFQWFKNIDDCETATEHGYVFPVSEQQDACSINGQTYPLNRGTMVRKAWNLVRKNPTERTRLLSHLFGRVDSELGHLMDKIPAVSESCISKHNQLFERFIAHLETF